MPNYRNYAVQIGHLGSDPEIADTEGGRRVVTFDVASAKRWRDKESGERQERTFWRRYQAWEPLADSIMKVLKKGSHVQIVSEPSNNNYEKEGVKHYQERHTVIDWLALDPKSPESATDE